MHGLRRRQLLLPHAQVREVALDARDGALRRQDLPRGLLAEERTSAGTGLEVREASKQFIRRFNGDGLMVPLDGLMVPLDGLMVTV